MRKIPGSLMNKKVIEKITSAIFLVALLFRVSNLPGKRTEKKKTRILAFKVSTITLSDDC